MSDDFNPYVLRRVGADAVATYQLVKRETMRFARIMEREFAHAVGGRTGGISEPDVISSIGAFEFRTGWNTKNSKGNRGDRAVLDAWITTHGGAGWLVQVLGTPAPPCISAGAFFELHGMPSGFADVIFDRYASGQTDPLTLFEPAT